MKNRVAHFEIPCDDPEKTMDFFKKVFNWSFQKYGEQEYWFAISGEETEPGINGAIMKRRSKEQPIVNSIQIKDIDKTSSEIERSGGQIVAPKMSIPGIGWSAYFKDPDGNIHGIWQEDVNAK